MERIRNIDRSVLDDTVGHPAPQEICHLWLHPVGAHRKTHGKEQEHPWSKRPDDSVNG